MVPKLEAPSSQPSQPLTSMMMPPQSSMDVFQQCALLLQMSGQMPGMQQFPGVPQGAMNPMMPFNMFMTPMVFPQVSTFF